MGKKAAGHGVLQRQNGRRDWVQRPESKAKIMWEVWFSQKVYFAVN